MKNSWFASMLILFALLSTTSCFSKAGTDAAEKIAASVPKLQPLKEIDSDVFKVAGQYSQRLKELNATAQSLTDIIGKGLQAGVTAEVGPRLDEQIGNFNKAIEDINSINVTAGVDEKTLAHLDGLLMVIERGVKVGLDADTLDGLDKLRVEMSNQPNRWQENISEVILTLEKSSSTVAKEVAGQLQSVLEIAQQETSQVLREAKLDVQEVVASTGAEGRCNADYLEEKVNSYIGNGLINRIKYSILGQGVPSTDLIVSGVCSFIPNKLTLVQNSDKIISSDASLSAWGYGFTKQNRPQVKIVDYEGNALSGISKISVLL